MTEIKVLLDSSGSMNRIKDDSIGGYNEFLSLQKDSENFENIYWSLYFFNNHYEQQFTNKKVKDVEFMKNEDFKPHGGTALYDAIGKLLNDTIEESYKNYIVVIITDGLENSSKLYTSEAVKAIINNKTSELRNENQASWDFVYLGANQDSFLESSKLGINKDATMDYNTNEKSVKALYKSVSEAVTRKISSQDKLSFLPIERINTMV